MELLDLEPTADPGGATTFAAALDGWTDAGRGGTTAADELRRRYPAVELGTFDVDVLFDFRDRRPLLPIDEGELGEPQWPELLLERVETPGGPLILVTGAEPDFRWPSLLDELVELADGWGLTNYIGLGSVPGPVPHTRPTRLLTTSNDDDLLLQYGRPQERVVVPASFQVMIESAMGESGRRAMGLWARVPHYVAGSYPSATSVLLQRLASHLGFAIDTSELDEEARENHVRLDEAAEGSPEVRQHIEALEGAYDATPIEEPIPSADQIAAHFERFLRNQPGG